MSPSQQVLINLQKALPGTLVSDDLLVLLPTGRFLRAFNLEKSLTDDDYFLLWGIVSALYSPTTYVYLNKCKRRDGKPFHITTEKVDEASQQALEVIKHGHLDYLRDLDTPEKFLQYIDSPRPFSLSPSFSTRVDRALTHYMLGNVHECIKNLEEALAKNVFPYSPVSLAVRSFLDDVRTNADSAVRKIESWERENLETLGLEDVAVSEHSKS